MMRRALPILLLASAVLALTPRTADLFPAARFPLQIDGSGRYLEDAEGKPFLLHGDTAWSLIAELTREETELYLQDRKARGFNALIVSLIERKFASNAPANAYGEQPFAAHGRFSQPRDAYFDHAEWVLRRAEEFGFIVLLAPAYLGFGGGEEGWYREVEAAGPTELEAYGRYLARRFGRLKNIIWMLGGDYDPPDKNLVRALVSGLAAGGAGGLRTIHAAPDTIVAVFWAEEPWIDIETVYTYSDVHAQVFERYAAKGGRPILMLETTYEGEREADARAVRAAAYGAMLAGAAGHVYGNNPMWHFSGPGIYPSEIGWKEALGSPGAESMTHLRRFFEMFPWWQLEPLPVGTLLEAPGTTGKLYVASTADHRLIIAYVSGLAQVILHPPEAGGHRLNIRWFDPALGQWTQKRNLENGRPMVILQPPSPQNGGGGEDWLLVMEAEEG
jgi:hypothetical protein